MTIHFCIRTDASGTIGTGHIMRCLAFAQAARDAGHTVQLITAAPLPPPLTECWANENIPVTPLVTLPGSADDAAKTAHLAQSQRSQWLLVDGYQFTAQYLQQCRGAHYRICSIDDLGSATPLPVDAILNPNSSATAALYPEQPGTTRRLLGANYLLQGRHIRALLATPAPPPAPSPTLLCFFGGSDTLQLTEALMSKIPELTARGWTVQFVLGATNPRTTALLARGETFAAAGHRIHHALAPERFAELARTCTAAVVAAGSTCWDLATLGIPQVAVLTADNQQIVAAGLRQHALGVVCTSEQIGPLDQLMPRIAAALQQPALADRSLFDGRGAERAVAALTQPTKQSD